MSGPRIVRIAACAASILLAIPCASRSPLRAADPWYEEYQRGLKAIAGRRWQEAQTRLLAALGSGPNPGRRVRTYGVRYIDYLPDYQLGIVYFNQRRYADALEQFAKVKASGLVESGDAEYQAMSEMIASCRVRTASTVTDATREATALVGFARELLAKGSLKEARQALDVARARDPRVAGLEALLADVARREGELSAAEAQAQAKPTPAADSPAKVVAAGREASAQALPSSSPSNRALDAEFTAAFEAYYAGQYAVAAPLFSRLAARSPANRPALLLYAACSRASVALLRQPVAKGELDEAKRLYRQAGPSAQSLIASDRFLSPRVIEVLTR